MADNKKYKADRQKVKELIEKLEEGMKQMDALRLSMETVWQSAEDLAKGMEDAMHGQQEEWEADRPKEDESEKTYQEVEVFGVPALFDNARILPEDVPEGLYCYSLRGSDSDPGEPLTVEHHVAVNHAASILTAVPLPIQGQGFLRLGEGLNFVGGMMAVGEFKEGHLGMDLDSLMEKMEDAVCHENEGLFLEPSAEYGRYAIYQINEDIVKDNYLFMSLELVKSRGIEVRGEDYSLIYGGKLSGDVTLEMLYEKFNIDHPEGFRGHSLSVSDVVVTNRNGEVRAYYVDSFGYTELLEFVKQRREMEEQAMEMSLEGVEVKGHFGTWHSVDSVELEGEEFFLMESDEYGDTVANIAVNEEGELVAEDLNDGFDAGFYEAVAGYFQEKGIECDLEIEMALDLDLHGTNSAEYQEVCPNMAGYGAGLELEDGDEPIDLGDEREKVLAEMRDILEDGGEIAENTKRPGEKEDGAVTYFKAKTEELFHSISDMNPSEIEETVKCHVQEKIDESGMDAVIVNVALVGSRCRGLEKDGSDLNVVVEVATDEREDHLFYVFNEGGLHIGEVAVDVNPITAQGTGTLETYLPQAEEYLERLRRARENEPVSLFHIRMNGGERWYNNTSGLDVKGLCKAYAECVNPLADMGKFGEHMEVADYNDIEQGERLDFSIEFNGETDKITIFDGMDFICRGMREMLFIQKMEDEPDAAAELAVKIDCLSYDCDAALYRESVESMEKNVSEVAGTIRQGDTAYLTEWLADIIENGEEPEKMERAVEILKELNDYKPFAQVEEQNCNMIDNVLNNGAGEKAQKEENKKLQEKSARRVSLKERLAQKQAVVSGRGNKAQENIEKKYREM